MAAVEVPPHKSGAVVCKPQPLMLKDFLRQDHNSDSFDKRHNLPAAAGSTDTVRYLLTPELNNGSSVPSDKRRGSRCSKVSTTPGCSGGRSNPFARLSAVIHALKMLPSLSNSTSSSIGSSSALTCGSTKQLYPQLLPRSLSRRFRRGFWRKCSDGQRRPLYELASRKVLVRDIVVRRASLDDDKSGSNNTLGLTHTATAHPQTHSPLQQKQQTPMPTTTPPSTSTSTARSSPARASCSCSASVSSWLELDSDSSSSGSESVGSSSSPVPGYSKPATAACLSEEKKRGDGNGAASVVSPTRKSVGGSPPAPKPTPTAGHHRCLPHEGADGKEGGSVMLFACSQLEDKDQLSPVAVVDFPSSDEEENDDRTSQLSAGGGAEEEEEEAESTVHSSPSSFQKRLASIERVKHRLMRKIQQFETLADLVDPGDDEATDAESVVDGHRIVCSEVEDEDKESTSSLAGDDDDDVEVRARELLESLKRSCACGRRKGQENKWRHEAVLLDLFIQRLWEHDERVRRWRWNDVTIDRDDGKQAVEDDLVRTARLWVEDEEIEGGIEKVKKKKKSSAVDVSSSKASLIKELDKDGPWGRCLDKEEDDVALALADSVLDSLLAELLLDMLLTPTHC